MKRSPVFDGSIVQRLARLTWKQKGDSAGFNYQSDHIGIFLIEKVLSEEYTIVSSVFRVNENISRMKYFGTYFLGMPILSKHMMTKWRVYMCTYIFIYICVYICTHMHMNTYIHIHTCIYA